MRNRNRDRDVDDGKKPFYRFEVSASGDRYYAVPLSNSAPLLPPGRYRIDSEFGDTMYFQKVEFVHDSIVELPSPEYTSILSDIRTFLQPETRDTYKEYGYVYKRSILLHGRPGTGKTTLVSRLSDDLVNQGGIVVECESFAYATLAVEILTQTQPDDLLMIVVEEAEEEFASGHPMKYVLNLLDGKLQRDNVIYLATTNYLDKVPKRLLRPGRFTRVVEAKYPNEQSRKAFLDAKLPSQDKKMIKTLLALSEGFSIDHLKELVLAVCVLGQDIMEAAERIGDQSKLESGLTSGAKSFTLQAKGNHDLAGGDEW